MCGPAAYLSGIIKSTCEILLEGQKCSRQWMVAVVSELVKVNLSKCKPEGFQIFHVHSLHPVRYSLQMFS